MAKKTKAPKLAELPPQPDATEPVDSGTLLQAAQPLLKLLEADLQDRAKASASVERALKERHAAEKAARRTADAFPQWLGRFVEQVAAAWFLSCVFVRTLEDRTLLGQNRIAGPGALDSQRLFLQLAPSLSERDYLLTVFRELTRLPAARGLFDAAHNPVWMLAPSAEGAKALLNLFRTPAADAPALRFGQADTRVLGDLYQDLNENVRKRYALLQTPDFVEEFILDRTLEPAIEKFGLEDTDLIDPTCGSGHFLLGAFQRLYEHRLRAQPGLAPREAASLALDKVYGSDINPYAVAVARFRLTLAYLDKAGFNKLADAPELPLHVVVADSLLHNPQLEQTSFKDREGFDSKVWGGKEFALENEPAAREVLHRRFASVVGNPPYITPKDATLRKRYRDNYSSASGQYQLGAPFTERFFQLARVAGRVGLINSNGFLKREFGKDLVEEILPRWNLDLIVNSSGAYIPGHGTPTILLFGSAEARTAEFILSVLSKRGEPATPDDPSTGLVWSSISKHWPDVGFENEYISVERVETEWADRHPLILAGGGAIELMKKLDALAEVRLGDLTSAVGRTTVAGEDDVWIAPPGCWERRGQGHLAVSLVIGECVRDWAISDPPDILYAYESLGGEPLGDDDSVTKELWPWRALLERRTVFGKQMKAVGRKWWEHLEHYADRLRTPLSITFAFVATHNHFVLDRGGKVFKQSAPIIKLPESATEDDHLALLAYLNSSTACFWMKQMFFDKGGGGIGGGLASAEWEKFFEFDGTKLKKLPILPGILSDRRLVDLAKQMEVIAQKAASLASVERVRENILSAKTWQELEELAVSDGEARESALDELIFLQEEVDWLVYEAAGLLGSASARGETWSIPTPQSCPSRASRPFAYAYASSGDVEREIERYFDFTGTSRPSSLAERGDDQVREKYAERSGLIDADKSLRMMESPAFKRNLRETWRMASMEDRLLELILNECETSLRHEAAITNGQILRAKGVDARLSGVELEEPGEIAAMVASGIELAAAPFLTACRFTKAGLKKSAAWQETWALQRQEDAGELVGGIPLPPKYSQKDFRSGNLYSLRGKLDVPKERFISYPGCESDEDGEPVYGWAGWDHLQRAKALVALYQDRKDREGWEKDRLTPMLAGVLELIPWLKQWHNEPSEEFDGLRMGDSYEAFLDGECRHFGLTQDDLRAWRPAEKKKGRKRPAKKA